MQFNTVLSASDPPVVINISLCDIVGAISE
jgi:hypothetical protein